MARQGRHNEALGVALMASTVGTVFGYVILLILIKPLSTAVLKLGPTEMFVVILWGLTLIANLRGANVTRGLLSGVLGLLMGTIGLRDRTSGVEGKRVSVRVTVGVRRRIKLKKRNNKKYKL